jgi:lipopolysaccharide biosynthesis glycosyltransferase
MSSTQINKECIVVIATENYLKELAITVYNVVKYLPNNIDLVIFKDFDSPVLSKLQKLHKNIKYKEINKAIYKNLSFENPWRKWQYNCGYRFEIFSLSEYEKICYIDLDIIIRNNFLDIFKYDCDAGFCNNRLGSIPEFNKAIGFNAGVCILSKKYLIPEMIDKFITIASRKDYSSDEAVLFSFFGNKYTTLPSEFNTLSSFITDQTIYNNAKIIHFIGHKKPWFSSAIESFDDYVKGFIGLHNCSFLYSKYKEYRNKSLEELKQYGIN